MTALAGQRVVVVGGTRGMGPGHRTGVAQGAEVVAVRQTGSPADVAHTAAFLMTSPQVTGTVIEVTGSETLINTLE